MSALQSEKTSSRHGPRDDDSEDRSSSSSVGDDLDANVDDEDLEVNLLSASFKERKRYQSFTPSVKFKDTELVYKEEFSRAAPRKGYEPKAFLAIGDTKNETPYYTGRPVAVSATVGRSIPVTASAARSQNQSISTLDPALQSAGSSDAGCVLRDRNSSHSARFYTPIPVSLPISLPAGPNTHILHPFKQAAYEDKPNHRRPTSPSSDLKQATLLATMEVGRIINKREKTPKTESSKPRLLKARLKPLNTVDVTGPSISQCRGVQPGAKTYGPSLVKTKKTQQLSKMLQHTGTFATSTEPSGRQDLSSHGQFSKTYREPTPSPYSSQTRLDAIELRNINTDPTEDKMAIPVKQDCKSESSQESGENETEATSLGTGYDQVGEPDMTEPRIKTINLEKELVKIVDKPDEFKKGVTFITDRLSNPTGSRRSSAKTNQACKEFTDSATPRVEDDDDDDDKEDGITHKNSNLHISSVRGQNLSAQHSQGKQSDVTHSSQGVNSDTMHCSHGVFNTALKHAEKPIKESIAPDDKSNSEGKPTAKTSYDTYREELSSHETFITSGFLALDSILTEMRQTLGRSLICNPMENRESEEDHLSTSTSFEDFINTCRDLATAGQPKVPLSSIEESRIAIYNHPSDLKISLHDDNIGVDESRVPAVSRASDPRHLLRESVYRETAMRDSADGLCGEISEYLLTKSRCPSLAAVQPQIISAPLSVAPSEIHTDVSPEPSYVCAPTFCDSSADVKAFEENDSLCFLEQLLCLLPTAKRTVEPKQNSSGKDASDLKMPDVLAGQTVRMEPRVHSILPLAMFPPLCFLINAASSPGSVFYFAYGADMYSKRLSSSLQRPIIERFWALLFGFQLVFNKRGIDDEAGCFPNIEFNPYTSTEGCVYTLNQRELDIVDGLHGYPKHFARIVLPVWICNSLTPDTYGIAQYCVPAVTYIAHDSWLTSHSPLQRLSRDNSVRQCIMGSEILTRNYQRHLAMMLC